MDIEPRHGLRHPSCEVQELVPVVPESFVEFFTIETSDDLIGHIVDIMSTSSPNEISL